MLLSVDLASEHCLCALTVWNRYELPNVGGSWVKKVELDYNLEHLYCCSDTDLYVYNLEGKQLFKFER